MITLPTRFKLLFLVFLTPIFLMGQAKPIFLNNPSFEDKPGHRKPPRGWFFCAPQLESPPDVHPSGMFGVEEQPKDGRTYVGMVVRDVGTWESIGQRLETPLLAGRCYQFSVWLALPQRYLSVSRQTGQPADYNRPTILRIWGGRLNCDKLALLAESSEIYHPDWKKYTFTIQPEEDYPVISLEAYYVKEILNPYCGSLLMDYASAILPFDCESGEYDFQAEKLSPPPPNWAEAQTFIQQNAEAIKLKPGGRWLEKQFYINQRGELAEGNIYLNRIALALKAFPEAKVNIQIPAFNTIQFNKCKENLTAQLIKWGVPESQWKLKRKKVKSMKDKQIRFDLNNNP